MATLMHSLQMCPNRTVFAVLVLLGSNRALAVLQFQNSKKCCNFCNFINDNFFLSFQHEQKPFVRSQPYFGTNPPNDACFGTSKFTRKCHLYPTSCKWNCRCYFWRESLQNVSSMYSHLYMYVLEFRYIWETFSVMPTLGLLWPNRDLHTFWKVGSFSQLKMLIGKKFEKRGFCFSF